MVWVFNGFHGVFCLGVPRIYTLRRAPCLPATFRTVARTNWAMLGHLQASLAESGVGGSNK